MNEYDNPFAPGAGSPPPELAGRKEILNQANLLFERILRQRAEKSLLLTGLRGVGKTVLLNEIQRLAESKDILTILVEAHEDKTLNELLLPNLRKLLFVLDRIEGAKDKIKRGFAVLRSFISTLKLNYDGIPVGLDIEPEKGTADSGDLEIDFPELLMVIAEAAQSRNKVVAILIDELQYLKEKELSALIMGMHKMQQRQLPLVLLGAGLPILPRLAGESKSYAERLFAFPEVGPLSEEHSREALESPVNREGATFSPGALTFIIQWSAGYPYFLQEYGYQCWNLATSYTITSEDAKKANIATIARLDENFFRVRYDRLTPSERKFLRAMADLGEGPYRISNIADKLGVKVNSVSPRRGALIRKGMIFSPNHGDLEFTVPLFGDYLRRIIPEFNH